MSRLLLTILALTASVPALAQQRVGTPFDLSKPAILEPGQAAIVVGFRRPDKMSRGKSGTVAFSRYDLSARDLLVRPKGSRETFRVIARSRRKSSPLEYVVVPVSPGDYVLSGALPGPDREPVNSFCLGTPTFRVDDGEVVYFGDVTPYILVRVREGGGNARAGLDPPLALNWLDAVTFSIFNNAIRKMKSEGRADAMAYSSNLLDAQRALRHQPMLAGALREASLRNHATYPCLAPSITAYVVPGAPALPPPVAQPDVVAGAN